MYEIIRKSLCQKITITGQQLCDMFEEDLENQPPLCCVADLQSWCTTNNITLSYDEPSNTFTLTPLSS